MFSYSLPPRKSQNHSGISLLSLVVCLPRRRSPTSHFPLTHHQLLERQRPTVAVWEASMFPSLREAAVLFHQSAPAERLSHDALSPFSLWSGHQTACSDGWWHSFLVCSSSLIPHRRDQTQSGTWRAEDVGIWWHHSEQSQPDLLKNQATVTQYMTNKLQNISTCSLGMEILLNSRYHGIRPIWWLWSMLYNTILCNHSFVFLVTLSTLIRRIIYDPALQLAATSNLQLRERTGFSQLSPPFPFTDINSSTRSTFIARPLLPLQRQCCMHQKTRKPAIKHDEAAHTLHTHRAQAHAEIRLQNEQTQFPVNH